MSGQSAGIERKMMGKITFVCRLRSRAPFNLIGMRPGLWRPGNLV
jgi:hypothetical protein